MAGYAVRVGDTVTVPGDMYGTVKFVGSVANKNGVFAGVQLANEFAPRGKNSGDVEGKYYFKTTIPGAGIFLPVDKAVKRPPAVNSTAAGMRPSAAAPGTPTRLTSFNVGGRTPATGKPNFSQSVSAAGRASPALKPPMRRESLPRPQSPLRKTATPGKALVTPKSRAAPASGLAKSQIGGPTGYRSAGPKPSLGGNKFSQSLRATSTTSNITARSEAESSLGPESSFDEVPEEDGESTPTPTPHVAGRKQSEVKQLEEVARLRSLLDEKDRALSDQNSSIAKMERNLNELSKLVPELSAEPPRSRSRSRLRQDIEDEDLPRDVAALRAALREKNEKIKLLTAEFDANRADFRSTIDTLEMASTETERVYEKRVDELLEEVRNLQDRSEDVESVAQQLKQLEELVQELEEGLEDARRGEAEARGEVEFLRGEVERSRSELRRERERKRTEEQLNGYGSDSGGHEQEKLDELQSQLDSKEDEIRGLKTIIRNLQTAEDTVGTTRNKPNGISNAAKSKILANGNCNGNGINDDSNANRNSMQQHIRELEDLLQQKTQHEQELEKENSQLRSSVHIGKFPMTGGSSAFGLRTGNSSRPTSRDMMPPLSPSRTRRTDLADNNDKHTSTGTQGSQRTVVLSPAAEKANTWQRADDDDVDDVVPDRKLPNHQRQQSADSNNEAASETSSSAALWCEICEEGGHDILSCKNMLASSDAMEDEPATQDTPSSPQHSRNKPSESMPKPLSMSRKSTRDSNQDSAPSKPPDAALPPPPVASTTATQRPSSFDDDDNDSDDLVTATQTPMLTPPKSSPSNSLEPEKQQSQERSVSAERQLKLPVEGTGAQAGMWAGKSSGLIDPDKWCALCERDGHESVDCPIEDAF
ncbi:uncharacterized protein AB675_10250 [Cyphellophora attinorum]|uniref:CAP-Gly domain-containing protein n=1 Tax=Cyphellophora attinorum TaxID=1664694 RepID=A0A0N1H0R4_9EURO|nr:uncharacterized protein AB675_10250 [Phialophora attinorum]KPI37413.1 hypothetical protein AB675_10250 [Phialophora attinorum]